MNTVTIDFRPLAETLVGFAQKNVVCLPYVHSICLGMKVDLPELRL